ncbi:YhgE/Pip domain-containing protein [Lacticaseibacillus sp. GG6-2]
MRTIGKLFLLDWRRLIKSPPAFLLVLALVVIPSLYCWFNVWALWDPYSNTQDLTVAVYSDDQAATFNHQKVAIGSQLMTELHHNKKLGWRFVHSKQAVVEGVRSGKYYAGIVVPQSFSKDLLTIVDGKVKKPELDYYVNEKVNAIAPKITASGATTLQSTISTQFVDTVAKTLMTEFNKAGIQLDDNLPLIRRFASLVTKTNDQLPTIESYLNEVETVRSQLPGIQKKLDDANAMASYLPEVNQMATKLTKANDYLPLADEAGQLAVQVRGKLPEVTNAGRQLQLVNANFSQLESGVQKALVVTHQGLKAIDSVDGTLPDLTNFGKQAQAAVKTTKSQVLPQVESSLTIVQNATTAGLTLIQTANTRLSQDLATINTQLADLDDSTDTATTKQAITTLLNQMAERQNNTATTATNLAKTLQQLQASYHALHPDDNNTSLNPAIQQLQATSTVATQLASQASALAAAAPSLSTTQLRSRLASLQQTADGFAQDATALQNIGLDASVQHLIAQFKQALNAADTTLNDINTKVLPQMPSLLKNTKALLQQAQTVLTKAQQELPALKQELADANTLLNGHMQQITGGINTVAELYQNDFPTLKAKLKAATAFVNNDLPGIEKELTTSLDLANTKMPVLASGLDDAHQLIRDDWPTLKTAIQKSAAAIKAGEQNVDLSALLKLLRRDAGKEANFLANPVTLHEKDLYPIPTYGSQSAPFYLALCIWVGALLLGAILITEYHLPEALQAATVKQQYIARWLTFVGLGMCQGLIAALGNLFLIGTYVVNKPLYLLFAMGLAAVFVSILYSLIALFGNIGKGIGIIILVLSISGAGGNFPVVLSGKFFQMINPWLPFTYAVNALRETVGGIYWPNLISDLWHLALFGIVFFFGGLLLKEPIRPLIDKMHAITKKSKIME